MTAYLFVSAAILAALAFVCDRQAAKLRTPCGFTFERWEMTTLARLLFIVSLVVAAVAIGGLMG
jgi:hypothetical protein